MIVLIAHSLLALAIARDVAHDAQKGGLSAASATEGITLHGADSDDDDLREEPNDDGDGLGEEPASIALAQVHGPDGDSDGDDDSGEEASLELRRSDGFSRTRAPTSIAVVHASSEEHGQTEARLDPKTGLEADGVAHASSEEHGQQEALLESVPRDDSQNSWWKDRRSFVEAEIQQSTGRRYPTWTGGSGISNPGFDIVDMHGEKGEIRGGGVNRGSTVYIQYDGKWWEEKVGHISEEAVKTAHTYTKEMIDVRLLQVFMKGGFGEPIYASDTVLLSKPAGAVKHDRVNNESGEPLDDWQMVLA